MGNCWQKPANSVHARPPPAAAYTPTSTTPFAGSYNKPVFTTPSPKNGRRRSSGPTDNVNKNIVHQYPTPPSSDDDRRRRQDEQLQAPSPSPPPSYQQLPQPPTTTKTASNNSSSSSSISGGGEGRSLKQFTYAELRSATRNFRPDTVLGEGGFGRVFKGWVDEKTYAPSKVGVGIPVAVKKSSPDSEQGLNEWHAEVRFLGKFEHPNLVKLLGYCWEDREFLLVYEYLQRGSLESHLFRRGAETLGWETRLKIALGAARGLEFLHSTEKQVIYRDFKASNILLDSDFNAKLSDFGLAKLGPVNGNSHVTTQVVGTYGYAAPEYMATGHLYVKSDVYGFGVVLLEIISGRRVLDLNRPSGEHNLVDWGRPLLSDKRKLRQLMDPQLEGQYPFKAIIQIAELILQCLEADPKKRPSMEEILESLEHLRSIQVKPKQSNKKSELHHQNHRHHRTSPLVHAKNVSASAVDTRPRQKLPISTRSY